MAVSKQKTFGPVTRKRDITPTGGIGNYTQKRVRNDGVILSPLTGTNFWKATGTQITTSEGHPFYSRKRGRAQDIGGPFFTQKKMIHGVHSGMVRYKHITGTGPSAINRDTVYYGPVCAVAPTSVSFPPSLVSSNDDLDEYGATAVARCKPTNPIVDLTAALGEIRQSGLPSLPASQSSWESFTSSARSSGDEYLNAQFGWVPFASDITAFGGGVMNAQSVIERYKAGIGKQTRRSYYFPDEVSLETEIASLNARPYGMGGSVPFSETGTVPGVLVRERKVERKRWFKGAFTYYFPYGLSGRLGEYAILARQLGLVPTPETIWNVAPWSWAVDWFSNTGDVISNWTSFHVDGLVMAYGYLMEHTIVTDTYSLEGYRLVDGSSYNVPPVQMVTETKVRRVANPYGFGVQWDGLSSFQNSILGALGLSKIFR